MSRNRGDSFRIELSLFSKKVLKLFNAAKVNNILQTNKQFYTNVTRLKSRTLGNSVVPEDQKNFLLSRDECCLSLVSALHSVTFSTKNLLLNKTESSTWSPLQQDQSPLCRIRSGFSDLFLPVEQTSTADRKRG